MNWGYKVMIGFMLFAGMMSFLVYRAYKTDFQLVEKEYYKSELKYQQIIDGKNRVYRLSSLPQIVQTDGTVNLQLPEEFKGNVVNGTIWFYCPYAAENDQRLTFKTDEQGKQNIKEQFRPGSYMVKIYWEIGGQSYYFEKQMDLS
ncbi:FixH family protein [Pollutibacter soli]|uniref:FixH family protein n=1 Tax=Pollutibacter soli TaxID=3034157 RepID=UPI003013378A